MVAERAPSLLTSNKHALCWGPRRARSRWQIPRLILGPCEHPRKDDKGGDNGCNDYCVYGRHDILFRDDRIRATAQSPKLVGRMLLVVAVTARIEQKRHQPAADQKRQHDAHDHRGMADGRHRRAGTTLRSSRLRRTTALQS